MHANAMLSKRIPSSSNSQLRRVKQEKRKQERAKRKAYTNGSRREANRGERESSRRQKARKVEEERKKKKRKRKQRGGGEERVESRKRIRDEIIKHPARMCANEKGGLNVQQRHNRSTERTDPNSAKGLNVALLSQRPTGVHLTCQV